MLQVLALSQQLEPPLPPTAVGSVSHEVSKTMRSTSTKYQSV